MDNDPQLLPPEPAPEAVAGFLAGERVRLVRFGQGAVLYCKGNRVRVAFDDPQKRRTVHAAYLQKVA